MVKSRFGKPKSLTDTFMEEFTKTAQGPGMAQGAEPGTSAAGGTMDGSGYMQQGPQAVQGMEAQLPQQMPPDQMMQPGMMPPMTSNNLRQSGLPTTAIVCTSSCKYAQNEKGMCSLNKINLEQVRGPVFQCIKFKEIESEQLVMPEDAQIM